MNRILLIAVLTGVVGCATPDVEPPAPLYSQEMVSGGDALLERRDPTIRLQSIDPPFGSEEPPVSVPEEPVAERELVCRWEIPTGSRMRRKVCSTKSFVDKKREADQEIFDDIKRNTAIGNATL